MSEVESPNLVDRGNFVGEWFGYRVFPQVQSDPESLGHQQTETCPFLSAAKGSASRCIKTEKSRGVCTVCTVTGGVRRDWLVCPYRALDPGLLNAAIGRLFGASDLDATVVPAIRLSTANMQLDVQEKLRSGRRVFIYFDEKLGGELSIPGTVRSPEFSFDVTIVEIELINVMPHVGRFGVLEIQTMDFHGTYGHAVQNLKDALRMFPANFTATIEANQRLLSERIEGPNIANVFKRTFYQMMFKFQLGRSNFSAGCALAIQQSVWDSWRPHLADVALRPFHDGTFDLFRPGQGRPSHVPAWIYVFDLKNSSGRGPDPIEIKSVIATDAASFSFFALEAAPDAALANIAAPNDMLTLLARRLSRFWPELAYTILIEGNPAVGRRRTRRAKVRSPQ
jgi:Restriction endonuclease NotI